MNRDPRKGYGWLVYIAKAVLFTFAVFSVSFGGWKLWSFFDSLKKSSPPSSPCAKIVTKIDEDEPDENALLEGIREANLIEDEDPIETSIRVMEWESAKALIIAKKERILASCEQSCRLESDYERMSWGGAPQSQLDPVYLKIEKERVVRQTEFDEIDVLFKKIATLEDTYPLIKERRRLERGHGAASSSAAEDAARRHRPRGRRQLGASSSRNPRNNAISRTRAPGTSDSKTLRIGD